MPTESEVRAALSRVIHPSYGLSLVGLGMVRDIAIDNAGIFVSLVMNCAGCPAGQLALGLAWRAIEALLPPGKCQANVRLLPEVWEPPPSWMLIDF
ncbi:MAG: iron-sulfur cluster assembly protein [Chloroflexota bacterium]